MEKNATRYHLLDVAWPSQSLAHSRGDYLHKTYIGKICKKEGGRQIEERVT